MNKWRMCIIACLVLPVSAWAEVNCRGGGGEEITLPASITAGPAVAPGTLLSSWTSAQTTEQFSCTWGFASRGVARAALINASTMEPSGMYVAHPDDASIRVPVLQTPVEGIGVAVAGVGGFVWTGNEKPKDRPLAPAADDTHMGELPVSCGPPCVGAAIISVRPRVAFVRLPGDIDADVVNVSGPLTYSATSGDNYVGPVREYVVSITGKTTIDAP